MAAYFILFLYGITGYVYCQDANHSFFHAEKGRILADFLYIIVLRCFCLRLGRFYAIIKSRFYLDFLRKEAAE